MSTAREDIAIVKAAVAGHGVPEHLLGLLGLLWGHAREVAPHNRMPCYRELTEVMDYIFSELDPANDMLYPDRVPQGPSWEASQRGSTRRTD